MLIKHANQRESEAWVKAKSMRIAPVGRLVDRDGFSPPKIDGKSAIEKITVPIPNTQSCQIIIL